MSDPNPDPCPGCIGTGTVLLITVVVDEASNRSRLVPYPACDGTGRIGGES